ncbi:hypothetical protein STCU_10097 [Strigomonas culicis]|uniref:Uncharacterized protein n=1 Tax=Strigomonas culicis TaxID=28005 RepID=S9UUN7_9TRYP|nr:hypothetical protein STCU_10097 [Strigomonas culicis]|eukprot:EPY18246.1 hypothetical protein STCU_10097 [Strigomonas culicis]
MTIAGIAAAIGGVVVLLVLVLVICLCCCKKKAETVHSIEAVNPLQRRVSAIAPVRDMEEIVRHFDRMDGDTGDHEDNSYTCARSDSKECFDTERELQVRSAASRTSRRSVRSARSVRGRSARQSQATFEDIDLTDMFGDGMDEIFE